jgi:hypothetical protein
MGLNSNPIFLGTKPILFIIESDVYPVIGPFWTLIRYGSLFICTIPLLSDEDDKTSDAAATIA